MINLFLAVLFFFLAVDLSHTVQLFFLIRMESALVDSIADLLHHRIIEIQIMEHAESHAKHFFCF